MKKFEEVLEALRGGMTMEEICLNHAKSYGENYTNVECVGNMVYEDEDLNVFLEEIGAKITDYGVGFAVIQTNDGKKYEVPYEDRPNRHGDDLPDETVLFFEFNRIYALQRTA